MKIQALRTLLDGNVLTKKGTIYEEDDWKARELIALGNAVQIPEVEESVAAPLVAANDRGESAGPFRGRPTGGRTGLAKPASSSQEAPAPQRRKSTKRKGASA